LFCVRCGAQMQENQQFCPSCGTPVRGATTLMPATGRIAGHIRLLGILWVALSAFRLIPGLFLIAFFGHGGMGLLPPEVPFFVHGILQAVGTVLVIGAAVGLLTGTGLLQRQAWARVPAIVLAFINLVDMPFGTALGIYTLWVLLPAKSEEEYNQLARSA
jgi:zinc-ribbon domain